MPFEIISELPRIREYKDFLSADDCKMLIDYAAPSVQPGMVVDPLGNSVIDYAHRDAFSTHFKNDNPLIDVIIDRVSNAIDIDKSCFEKITFIKYEPGQEFKFHQDYFVPTESINGKESATDIRCKDGGNRISTVLLYLNNVEDSGETIFPWLDVFIRPEIGKLLQFDYGYDDFMLNLKSQHAGLPPSTHDKWIATIWIRESPLTEKVVDYKKYNKENDIFYDIEDVSYSVECGPDYDKRTLEMILPGNANPRNSIVVGFTGGMDSCLVLYLLGVLNNNMTIPYHIQPICVTSTLCLDEDKIAEEWENAEYMSEFIRNKVGGNIKKLGYRSAAEHAIRTKQVGSGLYRNFMKPDFKARKYVYIYTGSNETPVGDDERWINAPIRPQTLEEPWEAPFKNLQKYHIVDLLIQFGLEEVIEHTAKCPRNHTDLNERCIAFACNERRWAFTKINTELGEKYFLNKGIIE
jgi:prolyl 4-hydroxylase